jgi:hypothetical protein
MYKPLTIGSKAFAINRGFIGKPTGGKIFQVRIIEYQKIDNKLEVVFRAVGSKVDLRLDNYLLFVDIQKAIDALMK